MYPNWSPNRGRRLTGLPAWAREIVLRRKAADLTQQTLADRLGVDRSHIARYESGRVRPFPDRYARIIEILEEASQ